MTKLKNRALQARVLALAGVACALVISLLVAGCSAGKSVDASQDRKAMMETVARWFVATYGTLDLNVEKSTVYDPGNILGLATATPAPASAPRTAIAWRWEGESIIMNPASQNTTITLTNSTAAPRQVELRSSSGQGGRS